MGGFQYWSLHSFFGFGGRKHTGKPCALQLHVEQLEDRVTPSTLDLTTHGAIGTINDALFRQFDAQPTGTGVINSFVRVQSNKGAVQQGYNTDFRKVQFDENTSPQFTRSLSLDAVPIVDIGGIKYRSSCSTSTRRHRRRCCRWTSCASIWATQATCTITTRCTS